IQKNDKNFYDVSDVSSLVDAILMDGLQSPLVVNRTGTEYVIISGHRRFAALTQIVTESLPIAEGKLFAKDISAGNIPCLVNEYKSELQAELALIRANSDTRVLTSAEIAQQAARVEELLYQLKEQGHNFPGKMRDYVAETCKISASKLARLKVIGDKLDPIFHKLWQKGDLKEASAYQLARLSPEHQNKIYEACKDNDSLKYLWENRVTDYEDKLKKLEKLRCSDNSLCTNEKNRWLKIVAGGYSYWPCATSCCSDCAFLGNCKMACPKLSDKIVKLKADAKAAKTQEALARQQSVTPQIDRAKAIWHRFGEARKTAGVSLQECFKTCGLYSSDKTVAEYEGKENGTAHMTSNEPMPYNYGLFLSAVDRLCTVADLFGCSLDYLFCRNEEQDEKEDF
ncbi:MAG: ParB N-terminal domain-containing protein, partial [Angelakisella sp.]